MEIYKLKNDELEVKEPSKIVKITGLKQGVKNPNRVNVFVDSKFSFSFDISQVVDFKIKVGQEIPEEKLFELQKASEFGKVYQRTLEWALARPRSEKETREYLYKKLKMSSSGRSSRPSSRGSSLSPRSDCGCPSEDISELSKKVIDQLISRGYLDDRKFAEWYVENRFVKKGVSRKRLEMELVKKGITRDDIGEVLGKRDDEEEIMKIIAKKRAKYDDDKLIAYLVRQGFPFELARSRVHEMD